MTLFQISQQCSVISEEFIFPYVRGTNFLAMTETKPNGIFSAKDSLFFHRTPEEIQHQQPHYIII